MSNNIRSLSPADFFSLLGYIRKNLSHTKGHYIDPLKLYPRFLKPTAEIMKNYFVYEENGEIAGAVLLLIGEYNFQNHKYKTSQIVIFSNNENIKAQLCEFAENKSSQLDCDLVFSIDPFPSSQNLGYGTTYVANKENICDNENIDEVFAFLHPRVLTKYDTIALKEILRTYPHYTCDDSEFISSLSSLDREPVVIKNSSGSVVGIFLCDDYCKISECYLRSTENLKDILKAYMIFHQLEKVSVLANPLQEKLQTLLKSFCILEGKRYSLYYKILKENVKIPENFFLKEYV